VLCFIYLTPGGARLLNEVAAWLDVDDPCDDAAAFTSRECNKLADALVTLASEAGVGRASGRSVSTHRASEACMEARSSLTHWGQSRGATQNASSAPLARSLASYARIELVAFLRLSNAAEWEASLLFWVRDRKQFPSLNIFSGSSFGAVASSSSCERAFLFPGRLVSKERSSPSLESVEIVAVGGSRGWKGSGPSAVDSTPPGAAPKYPDPGQQGNDLSESQGDRIWSGAGFFPRGFPNPPTTCLNFSLWRDLSVWRILGRLL